MPRLLIDGTAIKPDAKGVGRYSFQLVDQLTRRLDADWVIEILVSKEFIAQFTGMNVPRVFNVPKSSEFFKGVLVLPIFIFTRDYDVILIPMDTCDITLGKPTITVVHDIPQLINAASRGAPSLVRRAIDALKELIRVRMIRRSSVVICNSQFIKEQATNRYRLDPALVPVGYCGIDERFYDLHDDEAIAHWPVIATWPGFVLTFATGDPRETYDLCPAILERVRLGGSSVGLVIAGIRHGHAYAQNLREEFAKRGMFENIDFAFIPFLGESEFSQLRALYRGADFYLELSGHEGFGMQLAEAMACGTTCISSGRGALKEVGGDFAVGFDDMNPDRIANLLLASYQAQLHLRDNSMQIAYTRKFNWDAVGHLVASSLNVLTAARN